MVEKQKVTTMIAKSELVKIESRTAEVIAPARVLKVTTVAQENRALEALRLIKGQLTLIEKKRTSITKPINESLRTTNAMFKELSEPLKTADKIIRNKVLLFRAEQQDKADKERIRRENIQASHEAKGHEIHELVPVEADVGNSTTEMRWTYDLVDIKKVPKEYIELNLGAIRKAISGGERNIPGLKIYQKPVLSVR